MTVKARYVPGWLAMLIIALIATAVSGLVEVGGKHPLEAPVVAIILGIILCNSGLLPESTDEGIEAFKTPLILGIVLIGAGLELHNVASQGMLMLAVVVITMLVGFWSIYFLAKAFGLSQKLSILLSVGTTICGGSAIAVTSPLIDARQEETSYAIGTIGLWGLLALLLYPPLFRSFSYPHIDQLFGIFAGTAIHSTPQVVGAGFIFSEAAGQVATAVKLVRNTFIAPVAFIVAFWYSCHVAARAEECDEEAEEAQVNWVKAFPWFLFGYFVMVGLRNYGFFTEAGIASFTAAGKFLILLGMAGIGLNTRFKAFRGIGIKPLVVGFIGALIVAGVSLSLIFGLGLGQ